MPLFQKKNSAIYISSRIRLARNLAHTRFVNSADDNLLEDIRSKCADALAKVQKFKGGKFYAMETLESSQRHMLEEKHWASKELADAGVSKMGLYVSKDETCSAMINEEDHLRFQSISSGLSLGKIWRTINSVDTSAERFLEYAFSPEYGYLTACPTNVGTGMRASVMMHLSGLTHIGEIERVVRGLNQLGMVVRGASGEGSDSYGAFYQLSNQQTLGISEDEIVKKISKFAKKLAEFEINARYKLLEDRPLFLADKIERARAVLASCRLISASEAIGHLANLRMASDMGLLDGDCTELLDSLITSVKPAHLREIFSLPSEVSADIRDAARAKYLKQHIGKIPVLRKL